MRPGTAGAPAMPLSRFTAHVGPCSRSGGIGDSGYDLRMSSDPLKSALEEIAAKLDPDLLPLTQALSADEPVEEAWAAMLKEILDEA